LAVEARLLEGAVADGTIHYSRDPSKPMVSVGDAKAGLAHGGGTCTDIHSLYIALARSHGIHVHLQMGYRLKDTNEGKNEVRPAEAARVAVQSNGRRYCATPRHQGGELIDLGRADAARRVLPRDLGRWRSGRPVGFF
jgi:hypothetical protein